MSTFLDIVQAQALGLSKADRTRLLDRLVASLEADEAVEAAWDRLADGREAGLVAGSVAAVPLDEPMATLQARFPG